MDLETFIESLFAFIKNGENLYFVLYSAATCILTQIFKKIFVNKVKVDVLHKTDLAAVMPFVFGTVFSVIDALFVRGTGLNAFDKVCDCIIGAATIGALATVTFRFVSSLSGQSLKSLLKDDVFGAFYNQLLYFGTVREMLTSKKLGMKDFISEVKLLTVNAKAIYAENDVDSDSKRMKLFELMKGVINENDVSACVNVLHRTLSALYEKSDG